MVWSTILYIYSNSQISSIIFSNKRDESNNALNAVAFHLNNKQTLETQKLECELIDYSPIHVKHVKRIYVTDL
jgi:hypothetical protein